MEIVLVGLGLIVFWSVVTVLVLRARHAWRWGEISEAPTMVGEGAYRQTLVRTVRPRSVPACISWAAGLGFVWAALTFLVFVPAGLLLVELESVGAPWLLVLVLLAISGLGLAGMLLVAGTSLLRCRPNAAQRAKAAGWWSLLHHAAVLSTMVGLAIASDVEQLFSIALIPCLLGGLHAMAFIKASRIPGPAVPNGVARGGGGR